MHSSVFYLRDRFPLRAEPVSAVHPNAVQSPLPDPKTILIAVEPSQGPAAAIRTADTSSAVTYHK